MTVFSEPLIQVISWGNSFFFTAFNLLIHSTAIILVGFLVRQVLRKRSMALQSAVLRLCLAAVLVIPFVSGLYTFTGIEKLYLSLPAPDINSLPGLVNNTETATGNLPASAPRNTDLERGSIAARQTMREDNVSKHPTAIKGEGLADISNPALSSHDANPESGTQHSSTFALFSVTLILTVAIIWIGMSIILIFGEIRSFYRIGAIVRAAVPVKRSHTNSINGLSRKLRVPAPRILKHPEVKSAFLTGIFRPVIILPSGELESLMATKEVFLHELAHLKRRDHIWNFIANIGIILLPVQPLMWILAAQVEEASDFVSDDYVVSLLKDDRAYATQLYDMVNSRRIVHPKIAAGSAIFSVKSVLIKRIERILDSNQLRRLHSRFRDVASVAFLFTCSMFVTGFVGIKREILHLRDNIVEHASGFASRIKNSEHGMIPDIRTPLSFVSDDNAPKLDWQAPELSTVDSKSAATASASPANSISIEPGAAAAAAIQTPESDTGNPGNLGHPARITITSAVNRHDTADNEFLSSLSTSDSDYDVPAVIETFLSAPGPLALNSNIYVNSDAINMAALEIAVPGAYAHGDLTDPDRKRMSEFYRSIKKNQLNPVWSPDGSKIAFTDNNYGVWVVNADGGEPQLVYDNYFKMLYRGMKIHYDKIQTIGFSPDGSELAYRRYGIDLDRGTNVTINEQGMIATYFIEHALPVIESVKINSMKGADVESMERRILAESAVTGSWSPDGSFFAFISEDLDGNRALWLQDIDSGIPNEIPCEHPTTVQFEADSASLLVTAKVSADKSKIVRIDTLSGSEESVILSGNVTMSDLSPDGRWMLFTEESTAVSHGESEALTEFQPLLYDMHSGIMHSVATDEKKSAPWGRFSPDGNTLCLNLKEGDSWNIFMQDFTAPVSDFGEDKSVIPMTFSLRGNFPNPFNMSTTIEYTVAKSADTSLIIYNSLGQKVRRLISGNIEAGAHRILWDGLDDSGHTVSAGMYISKLRSGDRTATMKMTVIK